MRNEDIKVGAKSKSKRVQLVLKYRRPENVADCVAICKGNETAIAALFNRGYTIWLQDRFGRPMFEANESETAIQASFDAAVPGTTKGVSKTQPVATIPKGKSYTGEQFAELMAKQGFKVTLA